MLSFIYHRQYKEFLAFESASEKEIAILSKRRQRKKRPVQSLFDKSVGKIKFNNKKNLRKNYLKRKMAA